MASILVIECSDHIILAIRTHSAMDKVMKIASSSGVTASSASLTEMR
jgi:hypothetical protein